MRLVVQRVKKASVTVDETVVGSIDRGLLVLVGIHREDRAEQIDWLAEKMVNLRIFEDEQGKMNRSVLNVKGEILLVSQFTLYGNCRNGRRPDFLDAAKGAEAKELYLQFEEKTRQLMDGKVASGIFAAHMEVSLINEGPVTLIIEGRE